MNFIDIVLGILILFGLIRGFTKGLFVEITSLIALIAGIYGAIHFSYIIGDYLHLKMSWQKQYINLIAFAITFILIIIIVAFAGKLLTKIANFAMLGFVNKLAGAIFGGLKIAVILGAVLVFFNTTNNTISFVNRETLQESILFEPVKNIGAFVFNKVLQKTQK